MNSDQQCFEVWFQISRLKKKMTVSFFLITLALSTSLAINHGSLRNMHYLDEIKDLVKENQDLVKDGQNLVEDRYDDNNDLVENLINDDQISKPVITGLYQICK